MTALLSSVSTQTLTLNTAETNPPGTAGFVDPPPLCTVCLIPATSLVGCGDDLLVPQLAYVNAAWVNADNVVTIFDTHAHTLDAGPPEIQRCYYTGSGGSKWLDTQSYVVQVDALIYIELSWDESTLTGELTLHAIANYDTFWEQPYSVELIASTTYSNRAAFIAACNALLSALARYTLTAGTETGTIPSTLEAPNTTEITLT